MVICRNKNCPCFFHNIAHSLGNIDYKEQEEYFLSKEKVTQIMSYKYNYYYKRDEALIAKKKKGICTSYTLLVENCLSY